MLRFEVDWSDARIVQAGNEEDERMIISYVTEVKIGAQVRMD